METKRERKNYRAVVREYHVLPSLALVTLLAVFFLVAFTTSNNLIAGITAALPASLLLWWWVRAAKQVDKWLCPKCGGSFPKKMYWKYPPDNCPHCGEPVNKQEKGTA